MRKLLSGGYLEEVEEHLLKKEEETGLNNFSFASFVTLYELLNKNIGDLFSLSPFANI